jgi:hypothetical protein
LINFGFEENREACMVFLRGILVIHKKVIHNAKLSTGTILSLVDNAHDPGFT